MSHGTPFSVWIDSGHNLGTVDRSSLAFWFAHYRMKMDLALVGCTGRELRLTLWRIQYWLGVSLAESRLFGGSMESSYYLGH